MKRAQALRGLSREHNHALLLAREAVRTGRHGNGEAVQRQWQALADAWQQTMARHFADEERVLFPLLREIDEAALADRLLREHRAIERALSDPSRWDGERLEALGTVLRSHVRQEEREAFPLIEERAPAEALAVLAEPGGGD